jgi:predicted nuclease with TOPRIM domain
MFGIPEWALGVGFIMLVGTVVRSLFPRGPGRDRLRGARKGIKLGVTMAGETLDDVEARLAELEDAQKRGGGSEDLERRVAELEERVDFAERLLAKQRDAERLSPPQG